MYTPVHIDKEIPLQKPNGNWPMVCGSSYDRLWRIYMFVHVLCWDGLIVPSLVFTSGYHRNGGWRINSAVDVFNLSSLWNSVWSQVGVVKSLKTFNPTPFLYVVILPLEYSKTPLCVILVCSRLTMCHLRRDFNGWESVGISPSGHRIRPRMGRGYVSPLMTRFSLCNEPYHACSASEKSRETRCPRKESFTAEFHKQPVCIQSLRY